MTASETAEATMIKIGSDRAVLRELVSKVNSKLNQMFAAETDQRIAKQEATEENRKERYKKSERFLRLKAEWKKFEKELAARKFSKQDLTKTFNVRLKVNLPYSPLGNLTDAAGKSVSELKVEDIVYEFRHGDIPHTACGFKVEVLSSEGLSPEEERFVQYGLKLATKNWCDDTLKFFKAELEHSKELKSRITKFKNDFEAARTALGDGKAVIETLKA